VSATHSNVDLFNVVWNDFDRYYSYFDVKHVDWQAVYERYQPEAQRAANAGALAATIGRMIAELKDVHVWLKVPPRTLYLSAPGGRPTYFTWSYVLRYGNSRMTASRNIRYQMVSPDIGYIWISSLSGTGWAGEIDGVLDELRAARALILDVRNNGGGNSETGEALAGRFISTRYRYAWTRYRNGPHHADFTEFSPQEVRPAGPRQFQGPLIVLTNRRVASSAESFVLALRGRANTAVLGDTTGGATGNPVLRQLPNGWTYQVSQWRLYDTERHLVEDVGVAPTQFVAHSAADSIAGRDPQLEAAIAKAREARHVVSSRGSGMVAGTR
jgi:hypothetical protein